MVNLLARLEVVVPKLNFYNTILQVRFLLNSIKKEKIMSIKKFLSFVTIITLSLGFTSCSSFRTEVLLKDYDKISDTRFQNIIELLDKKDKEGLKKMFSPNVF